MSVEEMQKFLPEVNSGVKRECRVEWNEENVVATQLEGTWVANKELSLKLDAFYPSLSKVK